MLYRDEIIILIYFFYSLAFCSLGLVRLFCLLLQHSTSEQEAERQHIARELHDKTGQTLIGLAMGLRGITTKMPDTDDCQQPAKQLNALQEIAIQSSKGDGTHLIIHGTNLPLKQGSKEGRSWQFES